MLLTTGTMLTGSISLECIYLEELKLYTHWDATLHISPCPVPGSHHSILRIWVWLFESPSRSGIMQYSLLRILGTLVKNQMTIYMGFISVSDLFHLSCGFICVVFQVYLCCLRMQDFLIFKGWIASHCNIYHNLKIHLSIDGHLWIVLQ